MHSFPTLLVVVSLASRCESVACIHYMHPLQIDVAMVHSGIGCCKKGGEYSDGWRWMDVRTRFLFHRDRRTNKGSSSQQPMQPTRSDPINDTTAAVAAERSRRRALAPIRNDISEREREREKYNDGDDKSQVGLMIERRREEGKKRENGKSKRADDGNGRKHRNPPRKRDRGMIGGI